MPSRGTLFYLNTAHFADHFFLLIFPAAVIGVSRDWGLDYGAALAYGTATYVAFAAATLPCGWLGDRFDRRRLIAWQFLGCGGAAVICGVAGGPAMLMAGLGLLGVFAAIYHPVGLALVTETSRRPGHALAVNGVFGNLGLAAAALSAGVLTEWFGWRVAFIAPGLISFAFGVTCLRRFRSGADPGPHRRELPAPARIEVSRAGQLKVFALVLVVALFGGAVFNAVTISLPGLLDERLGAGHAGTASVGGYAGLVFAVAAFAQLPVGIALDRLGARSVLATLAACEVAVLLVISRIDGLPVVPLSLLLVVLLFASIPVTGYLLGTFIPPSLRARAFSAEYLLSLGMGAAVVPLMALGHGIGLGFETQYLVLSLSPVVVLAVALRLPPRQATRPQSVSCPSSTESRRPG